MTLKNGKSGKKNIKNSKEDNILTQVDSSKVARLKTVGITLSTELVLKARKYGLNISFLARKALLEEIIE